MEIDIDDNFSDESSEGSPDLDTDKSTTGTTLSEKKVQEQAQKNLLARKRIDELKEQRLLKSLLDDSEDW